MWLWDAAGKKYLDALAGIAVSGLGHAHPGLVRAIADQAAKVIHTSNLYEIPLQDRLAHRICALADAPRTVMHPNPTSAASRMSLGI